MARRNRKTLRNFFEAGALPSGDDFADLVDSTVNQIDDGFDKTPEDGLKSSARARSERLLSFYPHRQEDGGHWVVSYAANRDDLGFHWVGGPASGGDTPILTLSRRGSIGVDVHGTLRTRARIGVADGPDATVPANGAWQAITPEMTGCQALEVVAGFGQQRQGHYALVYAVALNAYNPSGLLGNFLRLKKRIRCQHAYYGARGDKLALRWATSEQDPRSYRLEIRSRCDFGEETHIQYFVTRLWSDPRMSGSARAPDAGEGREA